MARKTDETSTPAGLVCSVCQADLSGSVWPVIDSGIAYCPKCWCDANGRLRAFQCRACGIVAALPDGARCPACKARLSLDPVV